MDKKKIFLKKVVLKLVKKKISAWKKHLDKEISFQYF